MANYSLHSPPIPSDQLLFDSTNRTELALGQTTFLVPSAELAEHEIPAAPLADD